MYFRHWFGWVISKFVMDFRRNRKKCFDKSAGCFGNLWDGVGICGVSPQGNYLHIWCTFSCFSLRCSLRRESLAEIYTAFRRLEKDTTGCRECILQDWTRNPVIPWWGTAFACPMLIALNTQRTSSTCSNVGDKTAGQVKYWSHNCSNKNTWKYISNFKYCSLT